MSVAFDKLTSRDYWRARAPALHIDDRAVCEKAFCDARPGIETLRSRLLTEGYFKARNDWGVDLDLMAKTVRAMADDGIPPVFCFVYDEFWAPLRALAPLYRALLGEFAMLPDLWIWNVDPAKGQSGWRRHRDKGKRSLFPDGSPMSLSTWIAVSRATPSNGCMRLIPANADPTYNTPLERALSRLDLKACENLARVLPAEPGDFFVWNQAVLHWGGQSSPDGGESRISMACECQRTDVKPFRKFLIAPDAAMTFEKKLGLIGMQILHYRHMYRLDPSTERLARTLKHQYL